MYNLYMYCSDGKIFIEDNDLCIDCSNLGLGVVYLKDNLTVTNCGFFKKFKRSLHIVRNNDTDNID